MAEIMNTATVNFSFSDTRQSFETTSNVSVVNVREQTGLSIQKTAQMDTFEPGSIITYVIAIQNTGSNYFSGIRITDDLSGAGYLHYVVGSAVLYFNGQTQTPQIASTEPLVFTLPPLPSGMSMTLTYSCQVSFNLPSVVESITNSVTGIGYTYNSQVEASDSATITRSESSNLTITKESSDSDVNIGQVFNYIITLRNYGTSIANVSSISDNFPSTFTITSVSLKIGNGVNTVLDPSEYTITDSNNLSVPSATGPVITVPASSNNIPGTTILTVSGYFA